MAAFSRNEALVTHFLSSTPPEVLAIMALALFLIPLELSRSAPKKKKED